MPSLRSTLPQAIAAAITGAAAAGGPPTLPRAICTKIPSSKTSVVPWAKDAVGSPILTRFKAIDQLAVSPDGSHWCLTGRTTQDNSINIVMLVGSGTSGKVLCQEGQPFVGGLPGEEYFLFQSPNPAAWNTAGDMVFTARARGGSASTAQKVVRVVGNTHTIIHKQGDPAPGLIDDPPSASGDETFGQNFTSLFLLDNGKAAFRISPVNNCAPSRWPAIYHGTTPFRQAGISPIGPESWDNFTRDGYGGTPDGVHWFISGAVSSPDTFTDDILVVDDQIVLRESDPVPGGGAPLSHILFTRMLTTGDWLARGDDYLGGQWVVRNGALIAEGGAVLTPGSNEYWRYSFSGFAGNRMGQWVVAGATDALDPARNDVVVLNGVHVVVREGDPVDINGNGLPDDDAYIGRADTALGAFTPDNFFLTDDLMLYFIASLRNGAGQDLNSNPAFGPPTALLRIQLHCPADFNTDGFVDGIDYDEFNNAFESSDPSEQIRADYNGDGFVDGIDYDLFNGDFETGC